MENKKKNGLFWKVFAIALAAWCVICGALLIVGYNVMIDYDKSQRSVSQTAQEIAENISGGDLSYFKNSEVNSAALCFEKEDYLQKVSEVIAKEGGCFAKKGFSLDRYEKPVYVIMAGNIKLATVQFTKKEQKSSFGFDTFELEKFIPEISGKYAVSVVVPKNGQLKLNNVVVPDGFIEKEINDPENGTLACYKIEGLFNQEKPTYKEENDDEFYELVYDDEEKAWIAATRTITVVAPSNMKVLLGGVQVSDASHLKEEKEIKSLKTSMKYVDLKIKERTYVIEKVKPGAVITGVAFNGVIVTPEYNEKTETYTFGNGVSPKSLSGYNITEKELIDHAIGYARFVNNDGDRDVLILPYVLKGTQVYKDFDDFWVTFSRHNKYWTEDEKLTSIEFYDDNLFKATVNLTYWIEGFDGRTDNKKSYDTTVSFWYGKIDGKWKIIDWALN